MNEFVDMHVHSKFSIDGMSTMEDYCLIAGKTGTRVICFTEHVDFNSAEKNLSIVKDNRKQNFVVDDYFREINRLRKKYGSLTLLSGIEFSEPSLFPEEFALYSSYPFDCITAGIHHCYNSVFPGAGNLSVSKAIYEYYQIMQKTVELGGFQVLAHLDFPGYDRGEDGNLVVNEEQAVIVRRIYGLFLQGKTPYAIARQLTEEGIPTPGGKKNWGKKTVESILTNEKYKGDALLQKVYTTDFLTKKKKKNEGEVPQYYVEGNHEAIIPPAQFDRVQKEMQRRFGDTDRHGCVSIFSSKIRCGDCGGFYGSKVWHSNDKYRKVIWRCNHKYDDGKNCSTPHLDEETIKALYLKALRILGEERDEIIATFEAIKDEMYDTAELETEQAALQQEVMVVTELVEQCISENAHVAQNQKDYQKKYDALSERYDRTKERLDKVSGRIMERQAKREMIEAFLHDLAEMDEDVQEFTDDLWFNLLDYVTVFSKKDVRFTFKNGTEISVK